MAERVSPGQPIRSNPLVSDSATINDVLALVNRGKAGGFDGLGRLLPGSRLGSDFVMVKNASGAARDRGDVLQLGEYLLDDEDVRQPWFDGVQPAYPFNRCVILQQPAEVDQIVPAHASGVCVAKVNVDEITDTHARFMTNYTLKSGLAGPVELLSTATETGEQLMAVRIGRSGAARCQFGFTAQTITDAWDEWHRLTLDDGTSPLGELGTSSGPYVPALNMHLADEGFEPSLTASPYIYVGESGIYQVGVTVRAKSTGNIATTVFEVCQTEVGEFATAHVGMGIAALQTTSVLQGGYTFYQTTTTGLLPLIRGRFVSLRVHGYTNDPSPAGNVDVISGSIWLERIAEGDTADRTLI